MKVTPPLSLITRLHSWQPTWQPWTPLCSPPPLLLHSCQPTWQPQLLFCLGEMEHTARVNYMCQMLEVRWIQLLRRAHLGRPGGVGWGPWPGDKQVNYAFEGPLVFQHLLCIETRGTPLKQVYRTRLKYDEVFHRYILFIIIYTCKLWYHCDLCFGSWVTVVTRLRLSPDCI